MFGLVMMMMVMIIEIFQHQLRPILSHLGVLNLRHRNDKSRNKDATEEEKR